MSQYCELSGEWFGPAPSKYELAVEAGYDGPNPAARKQKFRCSDGFCGAYDCDRCRPGCCDDEDEDYEETGSVRVRKTKVVTARKRHTTWRGKIIEVGERCEVVSGFEYEVGGRRVKYFREYRKLTASELARLENLERELDKIPFRTKEKE